MAYRKMETQVPSFLDEFLDQIQPLPSQVKAKLAEMRELDDRAVAFMSEGERAASDAVQKSAAAKSVAGNDPLKRAFQDLLSCQSKAADCSAKKIELAESSYRLISETISSLDDKLRAYEAQLRKDGRWPATNNKNNEGANARKSASGRGSAAVIPAVGVADNKHTTAGAGGGQNADHHHHHDKHASAGVPKSRKRDREAERGSIKVAGSTNVAGAMAPQTTVANDATTPGGGALTQAEEATVIVDDTTLDPNEPRYCKCNDVSYGEMVACEGKNCPYEWFHYQCVGLTSAPKGSWYCPECKKQRRKRS
jgi:hypothetical protein